MSDLLIRNIPEHLKRVLQREAKAAGRSLSDQVKLRLQSAIGNAEPGKMDQNTNWFDKVRQSMVLDDDLSPDFTEVMEEIHKARKSDFGRSDPFSK